jgi:hypothetical protein
MTLESQATSSMNDPLNQALLQQDGQQQFRVATLSHHQDQRLSTLGQETRREMFRQAKAHQ